MYIYLQRIFPCPCDGSSLIPPFRKLIVIIGYQRTLLREETTNKTLQIQAIGLSLYEPVTGTSVEKLGEEVIRTQWLYVRP